MLIIGPSGSGKTNALLDLIQQDNNIIDKIYLYAKDLAEPKYQFFIKKCGNPGIKNLNDPNSFMGHSNTMDDIYENINDYNPKQKRNVLIIFDDIVYNVNTSKNFQKNN